LYNLQLDGATDADFENSRFRPIKKEIVISIFKGLGQAILGNISTDQMVIELTKIAK